jgi:hypothetical protein
MPDPKDNEKQTGDVHPPEVEDSGAAAASDSDDVEARAGRGENAAGFLKDRDAPATDGGRS